MEGGGAAAGELGRQAAKVWAAECGWVVVVGRGCGSEKVKVYAEHHRKMAKLT